MKILLILWIVLFEYPIQSLAAMIKMEHVKILKSSWIPRSIHLNTRSYIFCASICLSQNDCNAISYDENTKICQVGRKEGIMPPPDGTPASEITKLMIKFTNYTKIVYSKVLVAFGYAGYHLADVEIVDLLSPNTTCQSLQSLPNTNYYSSGGLGFDEKPMLCGGVFNDKTACYIYNDSAWQKSFSLNQGRYALSMTQSPFIDGNTKLFVTGGNTGSSVLSSSEVLGGNGWQFSVTLPVTIHYHCMVTVDPTAIMVIGGIQNGVISGNSFFFNSERKVWSQGPTLGVNRYDHGCGSIRMNSKANDISLIAVGGSDGSSHISSVEVFDLQTNIWRMGPVLPFGIQGAPLVEDPTGGVVLIGGRTNSGYLNTLYRLAHSGSDATWVSLPQKLKTARYQHTAFLIPNEITSCK